nr:myosin-2 heavy chain-like [Onthophagus taurus]
MEKNQEASDGSAGQAVPQTTRGDRSTTRDYEDHNLQDSASQSIEDYVFRRSSLTGRSPAKTATKINESASESMSEESESELNTTIIEAMAEEDEEKREMETREVEKSQYKWSLSDLEETTPTRMRTWSFSSLTKEEGRRMMEKERDKGRSAQNDISEEERMKQEDKNRREQGAKMKQMTNRLTQLIKVFRSNVENNTKREIKEAVGKLERIGAALETPDMKKWLEENIEERRKEVGQEREAENWENKEVGRRKEKKVTTQSTQTEPEEKETELDDELLKTTTTYEEWKKIEGKKWERRHFRKTRVVIGNPIWQKPVEDRIKVVMVESGEEQMEKGIQYMYKKKYPELIEIKDAYGEIEMTTKTRFNGQHRKSVEKVIKVMIEEGKGGLWKALINIKDRIEPRKIMAVHCLKEYSVDEMRKMVEVVFKDLEILVEIFTTPAKMEEDEEANKKDKNRAGEQRKTYALVVETQGKTFEEKVGEIKEQVKGSKEAEVIEGIKRTRDGKVLVITQRDKINTNKIEKMLTEKGQKVASRGVTERERKAYITIKGMEVTTTMEEIREAIKEKIGEAAGNESIISEIRPYAESMRAVTVQVNRSNAEKLTKEGKIRVGLAVCRTEKREEIRRCILCWSPLHVAKDCNNPNRKGCCYNCGEEGHQTKNCQNKEGCSDCDKEGHRAGTGRCPIYRELLRKAKMGREEGRNERGMEDKKNKRGSVTDDGAAEAQEIAQVETRNQEQREVEGGNEGITAERKRKKTGSDSGEQTRTESSPDIEDGNREKWQKQRMKVKKKRITKGDQIQTKKRPQEKSAQCQDKVSK